MLQARLEATQAQQHELVQQRARLLELLEQTTAKLNALQGRMVELTELLAMEGTT